MPPTKEHYQSSLERTGKEWKEVHDWVDEPEYKNERHDFTRIADFTPIVREKFGDEGVYEYINHIREDMDKKFAKLKKNTKRKWPMHMPILVSGGGNIDERLHHTARRY